MKLVKKVILAAVMMGTATAAHAGWWVNGIAYSNVCRANWNNAYYWVYPVDWAQPTNTFCRFPDGTPGYVSWN